MKPLRNYDVIIIGAGPAGLTCALELLDSKLQVLLLERKDVIGPKPCAGGARESEAIIELPREMTKRLDSQLSILGKSRVRISLRQDPFRCFERKDLGQYQLSRLKPPKGKSNNITIMCGTLVKEILKDTIVTNKGKFGYRKLVGADGAASLVRKYLGLPSKCSMGLYYNVYPTTEQLLSYYDPETLKTGYIWEFPHRECNNVGIYFDPRLLSADKAKKLLQDYLKRQNYQFAEKDFGGALINYGYCGHEYGNIYLVGDAGGFTSRLHGGGISNGMTSGQDVARLILNPQYQAEGIARVLKIKKDEDRLLDFAERIPAWLFKIIMWGLINAMKFNWVQKRLKLV